MSDARLADQEQNAALASICSHTVSDRDGAGEFRSARHEGGVLRVDPSVAGSPEIARRIVHRLAKAFCGAQSIARVHDRFTMTTRRKEQEQTLAKNCRFRLLECRSKIFRHSARLVFGSDSALLR